MSEVAALSAYGVLIEPATLKIERRLAGKEPEPYWDGWSRLRNDYDRRLPA